MRRLFAAILCCAMVFPLVGAQTWKPKTVNNEMTDQKTFTLSTTALIPATKQTAHLVVICPDTHQQETESRPDVVELFPPKLPERQIGVVIGVPFILSHSDGDLLLRFDDDPAEEYWFSVNKDLKSVISMQGRDITEEMAKSKRMRIQLAEYPSEITHVISFSLAGFNGSIKGHCGF